VLAAFDADVAAARAAAARVKTRPKVLSLYARGTNALYVFGKNTPAEAMVRLAGGENAVAGFEGSKVVTPEALSAAAPDVILIPSRGLESLGGREGLMRAPGVAETPAAKAQRIVAFDDVLLLGFGPRTGKAALELFRALHPELSDAGAKESF
jgi:iron complex transport system substrate-binding protein